jgi:ribokinase
MNEIRKPIVVVGSINMDLVARTPRIPLAGQTLIGTDFVTTPGGKGANQAVAAARLGYPVEMVGMVGGGAPGEADLSGKANLSSKAHLPGEANSSSEVPSPSEASPLREAGQDIFGQALLDNLAAAGVGTSAVERVAGPSGVAPILVGDNGENLIVVIPGANGKVDGAAVDRHAALIRSAGMVLCQLELPLTTVSRVLAICAEASVPVMLDPAPAAPLPDRIWSQVAWFTPNETEAAFYLGRKLEAEEAAQLLLQRGLRGVVLKRGGEGAYVALAGGKAEWVRPFCVKAIDTVGAGDCFNGAFAVALLEGRDPWTAARFASAAAAISVTRRGAQASMPSREETEEFLVQHKV